MLGFGAPSVSTSFGFALPLARQEAVFTSGPAAKEAKGRSAISVMRRMEIQDALTILQCTHGRSSKQDQKHPKIERL